MIMKPITGKPAPGANLGRTTIHRSVFFASGQRLCHPANCQKNGAL